MYFRFSGKKKKKKERFSFVTKSFINKILIKVNYHIVIFVNNSLNIFKKGSKKKSININFGLYGMQFARICNSVAVFFPNKIVLFLLHLQLLIMTVKN